MPFTQRVSDACQPPVKVGHVFSRKKSVSNNGTVHHSAAAVHNASLSSSSVYQVVKSRHFLAFSEIEERRRVDIGHCPKVHFLVHSLLSIEKQGPNICKPKPADDEASGGDACCI